MIRGHDEIWEYFSLAPWQALVDIIPCLIIPQEKQYKMKYSQVDLLNIHFVKKLTNLSWRWISCCLNNVSNQRGAVIEKKIFLGPMASKACIEIHQDEYGYLHGKCLIVGLGIGKYRQFAIVSGTFSRGSLVKGKALYTSGCIYEGSFYDTEPNGYGEFTFPFESIIYKGGFQNGFLDTKGKFTCADGFSYEGNFNLGEPNDTYSSKSITLGQRMQAIGAATHPHVRELINTGKCSYETKRRLPQLVVWCEQCKYGYCEHCACKCKKQEKSFNLYFKCQTSIRRHKKRLPGLKKLR